MPNSKDLLKKLGFKFGINGVHAARTMMFSDIQKLLRHASSQATRDDYKQLVVSENLLGKPSSKARELAFRHLVDLYDLDLTNPLFRMLLQVWHLDESAQPVLALLVALARDPLLRKTKTLILEKQLGESLHREEMEALLEKEFPQRFSEASLKSFAQNVNGTWTDAGYLVGRNRKHRSTPVLTPEILTFALFLGHLEGRSGTRLFSSTWMSILPGSPDELESLVKSASDRGQLVFMNAGGVKEIRFPGALSKEEELLRQEVRNVV